jgi:hypothetical protein
MTSAPDRPVAVTLRLYRAMADAFPYDSKNAYAEEMLQVTENAVESIWRCHGALGLLRLLGDVAIRGIQTTRFSSPVPRVRRVDLGIR